MGQSGKKVQNCTKSLRMSCDGRILPQNDQKQVLLRSIVSQSSTIRADVPLMGGSKKIKVILIGEKGIGKTSLVKNWLRGYKLNENEPPTRKYIDYDGEETQVKDVVHNLQVIDTVGGTLSDQIEQRKTNYKDCHLFLFCYNQKNNKTLEALEIYYKEVQDFLNSTEGSQTKQNAVKFLMACRDDDMTIKSESQGSDNGERGKDGQSRRVTQGDLVSLQN